MTRFRLILLSLFAVFAFSALASASASANKCLLGGINHKWLFCDHTGLEIASGTLFLGLGGLALLAGTVNGAEIKFHCLDFHIHGLLLPLGRIHRLRLWFLWCRVVKPATGCKLSAAQEKEIEATANGELTGGLSATFTGEGSGETFATLELENSGGTCPVTGALPVKGSQLVELPHGEESLVDHEIVAKKAGSHLTFNGQPASFSGTGKVHLASLLPWLVMLGV